MALKYFVDVARRAAPLVPVFFCVDNYLGTVKLVGGRSMQPTFNSNVQTSGKTHDAVLLDRWTARTLAYRRGDVVVLRSSHAPDEMLTKRVVGLPGDWVRPRAAVQAQKRAVAHVAAATAAEEDKAASAADAASAVDASGVRIVGSGGAAGAPAVAELHPSAWSLRRDDDEMLGGDVVHVPRGHLWVEGDNEASSNDSNGFGCVSAALVEARVSFKLWPLREAGAVHRIEPASERLVYRGTSEKMAHCVVEQNGVMPWRAVR